MINSKVCRKVGLVTASMASVALILGGCSTVEEDSQINKGPVTAEESATAEEDIVEDNAQADGPTFNSAQDQDTTDDLELDAPAEDVTTDGVDNVELDDYGNPIGNEHTDVDGNELEPVALEDRPLNGVEIPHELDEFSKTNWRDVNVEKNGGGHFMLVTEGMNQPFTMTVENGETGEILYYRKAQGRYTPYFAIPNAKGYEHIRVHGEVNDIPYDINLRIQETYTVNGPQVNSYGQIYVETDTKGNIQLTLRSGDNEIPIENHAK